LITTSLLLTLLKLDFFFVFSFAAQLIPSQRLGYHDTVTETVLVFIFGGIGLSLALIAVYQENKAAMLAFVTGGILSIVYFIYRIVVIARPRPSDDDPYLHTRQFLIFTTAVAAVLILFTVCVAIKCFLNVKNGIYIFKGKASLKAKEYDGNQHVAIDHDSLDDFEMNGQPNNTSKTLLEPNETHHNAPQSKTQQQNSNMWSIE
jgi:hypothetical protein